MERINGETILTGLLGSPVAHSRSPLLQNAAFELDGLNYVYLCFEADLSGLAAAVTGLKALGARGWNCTMPDKEGMCALCDRLSPAAELTGSVNMVVNDNGLLSGYNTDGSGYLLSLKADGIDPAGGKMTLLGTGGAARSIMTQAALDGIPDISVFGRRGPRFDRTEQIAKRLNEEYGCRVRLFDYSSPARLTSEIRESALLTNATNVGMGSDSESCLVTDPHAFHSGLAVSDIIYHPAETKLMKLAAAAGCRAVNGLTMLLYQGAEAYRLWTGKEMQVDKIRRLYFS